MSTNSLNDISKVYLEKVAQFHEAELAADKQRWEDLGGPTPGNYKPLDDSAKLNTEDSKWGYDSKGRSKNPKDIEKRVKVKEQFSDWRNDLFEGPGFKGGEEQAEKKVKEVKGIVNKVEINPKLAEVVQQMGGELIEAKEVDCECEDCGQDPCIECGESHHGVSERYDPMDDPEFDPDEAEKNRGVSGKNNPKGGKKLKDILKMGSIYGNKKKVKESLESDFEAEKKRRRARFKGEGGEGQENPLRSAQVRGHDQAPTAANLAAEKRRRELKKHPGINPVKGDEVKEGKIADALRKTIADMKAADRKAGLLPGGKDVVDLDVERQRRRKKDVSEATDAQLKAQEKAVFELEKKEANANRAQALKKRKKEIEEEVGISSTEKMAAARKEAELRRREELAKKRKDKTEKQKAAGRKAPVSAKKTITASQLKKYDTDGDGKVRIVNASYNPLGEEKKILPKLKMYRKAGNLARKGDPESMKKQTKIVSVLNKETEKGYKKAALDKLRDGSSPKHQVSEDKALDIVRANIIKKHGEGAIYDPKNPPKAQPKPKAKPDTRTPEQKKKDQEQANIDAQYGGRANRLAGRGLGT